MQRVCALRAFVLRRGDGTRVVKPGERVLLPESLASELIGAGKAEPAREADRGEDKPQPAQEAERNEDKPTQAPPDIVAVRRKKKGTHDAQ